MEGLDAFFFLCSRAINEKHALGIRKRDVVLIPLQILPIEFFRTKNHVMSETKKLSLSYHCFITIQTILLYIHGDIPIDFMSLIIELLK